MNHLLNTDICQICGKTFKKSDLFPAELVRETIVKQIKAEYPEWPVQGYICFSDLHRFRTKYVTTLLRDEMGEITNLEQEVSEKLLKHESLSSNIFDESLKDRTIGQIMADKIAAIGGSWVFIILFFLTLSVWITLNAVILTKPYDIYPFILLNLILSCLAAIQAPVIMMSQNRQAQKDRLNAENDYKVNIKAEIIIEQIHLKLNAIIDNQTAIMEKQNAK